MMLPTFNVTYYPLLTLVFGHRSGGYMQIRFWKWTSLSWPYFRRFCRCIPWYLYHIPTKSHKVCLNRHAVKMHWHNKNIKRKQLANKNSCKFHLETIYDKRMLAVFRLKTRIFWDIYERTKMVDWECTKRKCNNKTLYINKRYYVLTKQS